jgi:hypothetical protein
LAIIALTLLCISAVHSARADGEAGVVIDENGQVRTYCVAFEGDSISGDDLLQAAGINYEDLGTSAGAVLCAIEDTGCFDASSYNTCWCECQAGGSDCVYWAFFTRDHGAGWVYSARAFDRVDASDGDLHAWKWGRGGPSSAPRPSDAITFESVCGHPPGGGAQPPTSTAPAATLPPGGGNSPSPSPGTAPATSATDTSTPFTTVPPASPGTPGVSVTFTAQTTAITPLPPSTARDDNDDGGSPAALIGFGAVALVLAGAIGAAAYWRRTHGS